MNRNHPDLWLWPQHLGSLVVISLALQEKHRIQTVDDFSQVHCRMQVSGQVTSPSLESLENPGVTAKAFLPGPGDVTVRSWKQLSKAHLPEPHWWVPADYQKVDISRQQVQAWILFLGSPPGSQWRTKRNLKTEDWQGKDKYQLFKMAREFSAWWIARDRQWLSSILW